MLFLPRNLQFQFGCCCSHLFSTESARTLNSSTWSRVTMPSLSVPLPCDLSSTIRSRAQVLGRSMYNFLEADKNCSCHLHCKNVFQLFSRRVRLQSHHCDDRVQCSRFHHAVRSLASFGPWYVFSQHGCDPPFRVEVSSKISCHFLDRSGV